jgi:hypothetical protein
MLENALSANADLVTPGIVAGATTTVKTDPTDPLWDTTPVTYRPGELLLIKETGWASLDDKVHMITAVNAVSGDVTIATNTSAETDPLAAFGDMVINAFTWDEVCLSEFTPNPGSPGEIDVTTMCDVERVNLPGLPTPGTANFTGMFDLEDDGMNAMIAAQADGETRYFVGVSRRGQMAVFHGVVSAFAPGTMTVESALTYTGNFTLDQSPYYMINPVLAAA